MTNSILIYNPFATSNNGEYTAGGAITPGHLLTRSSATAVVAAATADAVVSEKLFADFNPFQNTTAGTKAIDTAYASGDLVQVIRAVPGMILYTWLDAGSTATFGSQLVVGTTDGTLAVGTVGTSTLAGAQVAIAEEAVTAGTAPARIRARIV